MVEKVELTQGGREEGREGEREKKREKWIGKGEGEEGEVRGGREGGSRGAEGKEGERERNSVQIIIIYILNKMYNHFIIGNRLKQWC